MRLKTPESQRRMAEMQHMRDCGFTLQQIGDQYGISRERVRQIVNNIHKKKSPCGVKNICYPNVKKWALDNGYVICNDGTISDLKHKLSNWLGGEQHYTCPDCKGSGKCVSHV